MKTLQQIGTKLGTEIKQDRYRLSNLESTKVDKIIGKGLSTEDYTTIEKSKLSGIEDGATADMTPSELLTAIKTVDGSGSGLDADLIDGMNAGSINVGSTVVARDSSGNFSAGTITANLSGNASSATVLAASKTIGMTGDVSWTSASFDGSTNVSGTATLATVVDSGTGTFKKINTDTKGRVTGTTPVVQADITELLGANSITNTMVFNIDWSKITTGKPTTIAGFGVSDAYTKTEIDGMLQGLKAKASVIVATTANITLSGTQTIDGVAVTAGQRVLVKNQTTASQNGIYVCSASAWSRSTDADTSTNIMSAYVFVEQGTANQDTAWVMNTDSVVLDTTLLTWVKFAGSGAYAATSHTHSAADITSGTLAVTVGGTGTTSSTGTGSVVLSTSPTLVTPNIGVASGTSFNSITGLSSTTPNMDGVASIGTSTTVARADHVHPAQTTIIGNAGTATTLATGRTISLTGDVIYTSDTFDGSANVTGTATLATVTDSGTGTFKKITVDTKGRVTGTVAVAQSDITGLLGASSITNTMLANTAVANLSGTNTGDETLSTIKTKLGITTLSGSNTGDQTITLTGDVTGTGTGSFATTLANTTVVAGTYGSASLIPTITVDSKGRLTGVSTNSILDIAGSITVTGGDLTMSGNTGTAITNATLSNTGVTAGTYKSVTVDVKGRVTGGTNPTTISGYGISDAYTKTEVDTFLVNKVDKVTGKGLSTEDYTTAEKTKLAGVEAGAQVNTVISVAGKTGAVSLAKSDVGLENVTNESKATMFTNPTFTGTATGTFSGSLSGNAATATNVAWSGITAKPTSLSGYGITDSVKNFGTVTVQGVAGSNQSCTTDQFITWLSNIGALSQSCVMKCTWDYAGNNNISDTGFDTLETAGCFIQVMSDGAQYIIRITSPSTGTGAGGIHEYINHGSGYSPGWRRVYTSNLNGNISGNASTATNVAWSGVTGRPVVTFFGFKIINKELFVTSTTANDDISNYDIGAISMVQGFNITNNNLGAIL